MTHCSLSVHATRFMHEPAREVTRRTRRLDRPPRPESRHLHAQCTGGERCGEVGHALPLVQSKPTGDAGRDDLPSKGSVA